MLLRRWFLTGLFIALSVAVQASEGNGKTSHAQVSGPVAPVTAPGVSPTAGKTSASGVGSAITVVHPLTVISGLGFILLLIFGSAWLMKRIGAVNPGGVAGMKIIAGLSVGTRERVLLVEVGEQQLLIGVAPGRITHLHSFDGRVIEPVAGGGGDFAERLKVLLNRSSGFGDGKS